MIAELPLDTIVNPPLFDDDDDEQMDEFDMELEDAACSQEKSIDFIEHNQSRGFKQGPCIIIEDKNINMSKRPGYITIDLDRREEPNVAHGPLCEDKGDEIDRETCIPSQY